MGLFSDDKKLNALHDDLENVVRQLIELRNEQKEIKSDYRRLETEWLSTHDKFKQIMGRLNKRAEREPDTPPDPPGGPNGPEPAGPYDHLDPISKGIMERRSRR